MIRQHSVASDVGLHCLLNTLLGISRLQWVKQTFAFSLICLLDLQLSWEVLLNTASDQGLHCLPLIWQSLKICHYNDKQNNLIYELTRVGVDQLLVGMCRQCFQSEIGIAKN